jgi:hypothetical protein
MLVIGTLLVGVENVYGWYNLNDIATNHITNCKVVRNG